MYKIGRNDPCYCGSGEKYKKCCIDKYTTKEGEHLILEIGDYGEPILDDIFFKNNPIKLISAQYLFFFKFSRFKNEEAIIKAVIDRNPSVLQRAENQKQAIENANKEQLKEFVVKGVDNLNQFVLFEKIKPYVKEFKLNIFSVLEDTNDDLVIDTNIRLIHHFYKELDLEHTLIQLIQKPIKNAYISSQLCTIVGLLKFKHAKQLMWNCFHEFKKIHPYQEYYMGPLIALTEIMEYEPHVIR